MIVNLSICVFFFAAVWDRQSHNEITYSQVLAIKAWNQSGMHNQAKLERTTLVMTLSTDTIFPIRLIANEWYFF